jgi:hypothetical protein
MRRFLTGLSIALVLTSSLAAQQFPKAGTGTVVLRAARIIDQLEARGYIGAFDGSNARQVLRRDGGSATQGVVGDDADEDGER